MKEALTSFGRQALGEALRAQACQMFHWWHQVRDGTLAHATLKLQHRHVLHVLDYLPAASEAAHAGKPRRPCYQALDQLKKSMRLVA